MKVIHSFAAPRARQLEKTSAAGATLMITVRESQAEMLPVLLPALAAGLAPTGKAAFAGGRLLVLLSDAAPSDAFLRAVKAMVDQGYVDRYIVPADGLRDEIAERYSVESDFALPAKRCLLQT